MKSFFSIVLANVFIICSAFSQQVKSDKFIVYLFLLEDCKICQSYVKTLNQLQEKYECDSIVFRSFFSSPSSSMEGILKFKEKYHLEIPTFFDSLQLTAKNFGIHVMPECLVYNIAKQQIMYQGRIDNWFAAIGKRRAKPTEFNLLDALESIRQGKEISLKRTNPIGCLLTDR
ncbi:MAG: hypothetical protein IPP01_15070 [Saprospiraceae bacterium]|nr:hypothetical protein [Saprospiraceae bacterium]